MKNVEYIDEQIFKRFNFNIKDFIENEEKSEIIDTLIFCFDRYYDRGVIEIIFDSYDYIIRLDAEDWKKIVNNLNGLGEYAFVGFIVGYCYFDEKYLRNMGFSFDNMEHALDGAEYYTKSMSLNNSYHFDYSKRNKSREEYHPLSPEQYLNLYYMFCYSCPVDALVRMNDGTVDL